MCGMCTLEQLAVCLDREKDVTVMLLYFNIYNCAYISPIASIPFSKY